MMIVFFKGILIGFLISVPVGPIAVICIQRALSGKKRHGFISGVGAATADTAVAALAVLGVSCVSEILISHQKLLAFLGAVVLLLYAVTTFFKSGQRQVHANDLATHAGNFFSTFTLSLLNPMTILAFVAILSTFSLQECCLTQGTFLIAGVFVGSSLWWLALSFLAGHLRKWVEDDHLTTINRVTGVIMFVFAIAVLVKVMAHTPQF